MRRAAAVVVLVITASLVAGACAKKGGYDFPDHPPTTDPQEVTTVPDFSNVRLAGIPGRTTTTIDNTPGQATLAGAVVAPEGAVPGATVHIERLVGDAVLAIDVATNPDGTWKLENIKGGRYRVRAWRQPDLALTDPQIFFLGGNERKLNLALQVRRFTGTNVAGAIAPNPPQVDEPANLVVQVTTVVVDAAGIVRATPQPNILVELQGTGGWRTDSPSSSTTDSNGQVFWRMTCTSSGNQPLAALVNAVSYPLNLSGCVEGPAATSAPAPAPSPSTTAFNFQTTTTTRRR